MKKIIYILLLLGITVQAQFTASVGVIASQSTASGPTTYPAWDNSSTLIIDAVGEDLEVNYPTVSADDLMVMVILSKVQNVTIATPSGWTAINTNTSTTGFISTGIFYKRATGSESGTLTVPNTYINSYANMHAFTDVLTSGTPFEGVVEQAPGTATQTVYSLTNGLPSGDKRLAVMIGIQNNDDNVVDTSTGYTLRNEQNSNVGSDGSILIMDQQIATSTTADGQVTLTIPTARYLTTIGFFLKPNE